jgi:hypothetical protein
LQDVRDLPLTLLLAELTIVTLQLELVTSTSPLVFVSKILLVMMEMDALSTLAIWSTINVLPPILIVGMLFPMEDAQLEPLSPKPMQLELLFGQEPLRALSLNSTQQLDFQSTMEPSTGIVINLLATMDNQATTFAILVEKETTLAAESLLELAQLLDVSIRFAQVKEPGPMDKL